MHYQIIAVNVDLPNHSEWFFHSDQQTGLPEGRGGALTEPAQLF